MVAPAPLYVGHYDLSSPALLLSLCHSTGSQCSETSFLLCFAKLPLLALFCLLCTTRLVSEQWLPSFRAVACQQLSQVFKLNRFRYMSFANWCPFEKKSDQASRQGQVKAGVPSANATSLLFTTCLPGSTIHTSNKLPGLCGWEHYIWFLYFSL